MSTIRNMLRICLGKIGFALFCLLAAPCLQTASAQDRVVQPTPDLLAQNQPVIVSVEAHAGRPYGIGKILFRLRSGDELISRTGATWLTERNDRIRYPVISQTPARRLLKILTQNQRSDPDDLLTAWFLFEGDEPLNMQLHGTGIAQFDMPVQFTRPNRYERFAKTWWQNFNSSAERTISGGGDYPPLVEAYLLSLVGRRLGMNPQFNSRRSDDALTRTFELLFDVEALRIDNIQKAMIKGVDTQAADRPLPKPIEWSPVVVSDLPDDIEIEPIAKSVPKECFYLRFGTWENQIWLQRLTEEYGGDLGQMIALRGFKSEIQSKFLDQLAIQSSEFDNLFGGNLIADVAVIGTDTYLDAGASIGVLFHAHNTALLKSNLTGKRKTFAGEHKSDGVKIREVEIAGVKASLLISSDNRYRSFYIVSGDNHLITSSETVARRFIESSNGKGSLADSAEFRYARYKMPLDREDTLFVYISTAFLQQLLKPEYQIELRRRNQSVSDMLLLEMATLAASGEGVKDVSIPNLIRGGFLPDNFGFHVDGSELNYKDGVWRDSIRGQRGYFKPIPDVVVKNATPEESRWFSERATYFATKIRSLDPMSIGVLRFAKDDEDGKSVERVVFDARLLPFGQESYEWLLNLLGPPLKQEVKRSPKDIVRIEASLQGSGGGLIGPAVQPHQLFGAVQDYLDPNLDLRPKSIFKTLETVKEAPGYVGAWPNPGYTDWMPRLGGDPDPHGYTYSPLLALWRLQWNDFSVLAFDQQRLENLKPHLQRVTSERPAQIRLEVGDLLNSKIKAWANTITYRRAWQTSIANVQLLNHLVQQFDIPPDVALETAERMLNVDLVCSLRGEYELVQLPSGRKVWHSTKWPSFSVPQLPDSYTAPLLLWFRGLHVEVTREPTQFTIHGYIDIQRSKKKTGLPSFEVFKGFGNLFGGGAKKKDKDKDKDKKQEATKDEAKKEAKDEKKK